MARTTSYRVGSKAFALFLVLIVGFLVFINIAVRPPASRDDMPGGNYRSEGIFNPRPTVYGLLDPETAPDGTTYRWSTSHATLTFPYIANLGRYADVTVRLAAKRPPGQPPARVTISLNGNPYPSFEVPDAFTVYNFSIDTREVPNPYLDPAHVQLDVQSTTYSPSPGKDLGVAIDWIELQPHRDAVEIAFGILAWLSGLSVIILIALARLSQAWALVYGAGASATFLLASLTYTPVAFPPAAEILLLGLAWAVAVWLTPARQPAWGFALAGVCLWIVLAGRLFTDWQVDDAYISYRYAWNLAHGHGLVYNPGEVVEGYTNFLWTLIAAAAIAAGLHPAGVMLALTIAFAIGLVALTYYLGARLAGMSTTSDNLTTAHVWALLSAVVLALDSSFITYGARGSGIEAVPFAFFVLTAAVLIWLPPDRKRARLYLIGGGIFLALASLTRPEGLAIAIIFISVKAWSSWRDSTPDGGISARWRKTWTVLVPVSLPYLLIMIPYEIWRLSFYGYPFPNTFYAKTGTSLAFLQRGWNYTWPFITDHWFVALLALLGLIGLAFEATRRWMTRLRSKPVEGSAQGAPGAISGPDRSRDIIAALAITVFLYGVYIIAVGGDHFPAGRFFVPLLAPLILLAQEAARWGLSRISAAGRVRALAHAALGLGVVVYSVGSISLQDPQGPLARRTNRDTNFVNIWGSAGLWLRDHTPAETWAASPVAGAIGYYSERRVVDMLGINDLHIGHEQIPTMGSGLAGHEKQDPAYVLGRRPQYILPYPNYFVPVADRFDTEYMTVTVRGPLGPDISWWTRRDAGPPGKGGLGPVR